MLTLTCSQHLPCYFFFIGTPPQNPPALLLVMCLAGSKKRAAQLQQARGKDCLPCLTGAERHKIQQFPKTCSKKAVHTMGTVA